MSKSASVGAGAIVDSPNLIATMAAGITLEPGDIIATSTAAGVGRLRPPRLRRADHDWGSPSGMLENPVL